MAQYIVTGSYTSAAMKGMIAHPSDREKATAALIAAAGGKLESYFLTTGETGQPGSWPTVLLLNPNEFNNQISEKGDVYDTTTPV